MNNMIDQWLKERQELLVLFHQIIHADTNTHTDRTTDTFADTNIKPITGVFTEKDGLQNFCQTLIDYVSLGHFRIFEKLAEAQQKFQTNSKGLNQHLMTKILRTTLFALDFNDKYTANNDQVELKQDLSKLGEHLAHRLDWEDELIQDYLKLSGQEASPYNNLLNSSSM